MSTEGVAVVVIVVVLLSIVVAAAMTIMSARRRRRLRQRFGPEYDRVVRARGSRRDAERELVERERRVSGYDLRPLAPDQRQRYAAAWLSVQERFVDDPGGAVSAAQRLVTVVMSERGYPSEGFEQGISDLSVWHGRVVDHYRSAHRISGLAARGEATTEELRQAMVHYRELVTGLLDEQGEVAPDQRASAPPGGSLPGAKGTGYEMA